MKGNAREILLMLALWNLAVSAASPTIGKCPVFPANNVWNIRVDKFPAARNSAILIKAVGLTSSLNAGFGPGIVNFLPFGIPYNTFSKTSNNQGFSTFVPKFTFANESDNGPYPLSVTSVIEAPPFRRVIHINTDTCQLWEMRGLARQGLTRISAESGAAWNLRSNHLRPVGKRSADLAGLPIFPGLARIIEVQAGAINHALRFTAPLTRKNFVWPARHYSINGTHNRLHPSMGMRVRLKARFDISGFPPQAQIILQALKTYGMMLADQGPAWQLSGEPHYAWNRAALASLKRVTGADLEFVSMGLVKQLQ